jgi:hypothetical protein
MARPRTFYRPRKSPQTSKSQDGGRFSLSRFRAK